MLPCQRQIDILVQAPLPTTNEMQCTFYESKMEVQIIWASTSAQDIGANNYWQYSILGNRHVTCWTGQTHYTYVALWSHPLTRVQDHITVTLIASKIMRRTTLRPGSHKVHLAPTSCRIACSWACLRWKGTGSGCQGIAQLMPRCTHHRCDAWSGSRCHTEWSLRIPKLLVHRTKQLTQVPMGRKSATQHST